MINEHKLLYNLVCKSLLHNNVNLHIKKAARLFMKWVTECCVSLAMINIILYRYTLLFPFYLINYPVLFVFEQDSLKLINYKL